MWSFRAYLKAKCADPSFNERYHEQCAICPKTVLIFTAIRERRLPHEEVAARAGVDPERLRLLEAAEECDFEEVRKLGRCLGLDLPEECRKKEWLRSRDENSKNQR